MKKLLLGFVFCLGVSVFGVESGFAESPAAAPSSGQAKPQSKPVERCTTENNATGICYEKSCPDGQSLVDEDATNGGDDGCAAGKVCCTAPPWKNPDAGKATPPLTKTTSVTSSGGGFFESVVGFFVKPLAAGTEAIGEALTGGKKFLGAATKKAMKGLASVPDAIKKALEKLGGKDSDFLLPGSEYKCTPIEEEPEDEGSELGTGYDSEQVFPTWGKDGVQGIIGSNEKGEDRLAQLRSGNTRLLLYIIPRIIDILLKFIAPIIVVMFIYAGIQFVYAGDNDEQIESSKKFFHFALMGTIFIVLSYSIMKSVYFILASGGGAPPPQVEYKCEEIKKGERPKPPAPAPAAPATPAPAQKTPAAPAKPAPKPETQKPPAEGGGR